MRASFKSAIVASMTALALATSVAAADARPFWPHNHWHHGFGWGPGIAVGVVGAAAAGACLRYQPVYDAYGNYVGRNLVNVCY